MVKKGSKTKVRATWRSLLVLLHVLLSLLVLSTVSCAAGIDSFNKLVHSSNWSQWKETAGKFFLHLHQPCSVQKLGALHTEPEHLAKFGLALDEIVKTPLGLFGTVIGVKYVSAEQAESFSGGKLWIRYTNGLESPVEYEETHGYTKGTISEHIARDVVCYNAELDRMAEERRQQEEEARLHALGIAPPSKGKEKGGGKKKKK
jgi:hypothetical protein